MKTNKALQLITGALIVALIVLKACTFQVREGHAAVVTRFSDPRRIVIEPGLHVKWPSPFETAYDQDLRKRLYNTGFRETLTRDKKNIILMSYVVWSVEDPRKFVEANGSLVFATARKAVERNLDGNISSVKSTVLGNYNMSAMISTDPSTLKMDEIEKTITSQVRQYAHAKLGIKVYQVGLKRLAFPEANVSEVFKQMRAERAKYTAAALSEGRRRSREIRDKTNVDKARIESSAVRKAAEIRAQADAKAARILAAAQSKDPEFYRFLRSLDVLKKTLRGNAGVILRTDSPPFDVLTDDGLSHGGKSR